MKRSALKKLISEIVRIALHEDDTADASIQKAKRTVVDKLKQNKELTDSESELAVSSIDKDQRNRVAQNMNLQATKSTNSIYEAAESRQWYIPYARDVAQALGVKLIKADSIFYEEDDEGGETWSGQFSMTILRPRMLGSRIKDVVVNTLDGGIHSDYSPTSNWFHQGYLQSIKREGNNIILIIDVHGGIDV